MRILLTGHKGYIGAVMTAMLTSAGNSVVGLDTNFFEDCVLGQVEDVIPEIRKDIRDITLDDLAGFDAVVHLAALSNDPLGDFAPSVTYNINLDATIQLAKIARDAGVKRFLYSSSCSIYGAAKGDDFLDENAPFNPVTPYAESKIKAEEALHKLADSGFSPVFMRNATAYGFSPRLRADVVLNNLVAWAYTTGKIRIMSDGFPWRPIVHIEDISRAFLVVLSSERHVVHNQAFNVGVNSENYQVRDLANIVKTVIPNAEVEYAAGSGYDPRNYRVDFSKLKKSLPDFSPQWNALSGAHQLYDAYRENNMQMEDFVGRKYVRLNQLKHLISEQRIDDQLRWREAPNE
jgi:nucleoside-diphosphate-sugar epimerase